MILLIRLVRQAAIQIVIKVQCKIIKYCILDTYDYY